MATKLGISDLADVLAAIKEVTKPYQLGIQLKLGPSELDEIEKNYRGDIDRQKTEVVKYWLRNSPDASWTTLANAVEGMGGYAGLVKSLRAETKTEEEKQNVLAIDVEKMGGRAGGEDAVERVISNHKEERRTTAYYMWTPSAEDKDYTYEPQRRMVSKVSSLDECVHHSILLLGKMGHGTSTLGNRMLDREG
jgi:hypothetical protein